MPEIIIDEETTQQERLLNFIISMGGRATTIDIRRYGLDNGILQADRRIRELRQNYPNGLSKFNYPDLVLESRKINAKEMEQRGIKCKRIVVYYLTEKSKVLGNNTLMTPAENKPEAAEIPSNIKVITTPADILPVNTSDNGELKLFQ